MEGVGDSAGSLVDWLVRHNFVSSYEELASKDIATKKKSSDVYFVPAFLGNSKTIFYVLLICVLGLASPFFNPGARATFVGISESTDRHDLVRAALESIGFRLSQIIRTISSDNPSLKISTLYVNGGVSRSDFVLQTIADLTGLKVVRCPDLETASLGKNSSEAEAYSRLFCSCVYLFRSCIFRWN